MEYNKRVVNFIKIYVNRSTYVNNDYIRTFFKAKYNNKLTGRTLFAIINKKDIEDTLNINDINNNTFVTNELSKRWNDLSQDKKEAYEHLSKCYFLFR
jgi:hypothetical protein